MLWSSAKADNATPPDDNETGTIADYDGWPFELYPLTGGASRPAPQTWDPDDNEILEDWLNEGDADL